MLRCRDVMNQLGFDVTIEHEGTIEGAMFCKTVFAVENGAVVGYKRLDHALAKLGWYDKPLCHRKAKDILRGKLCSFTAMYRGWPMAVELAKTIDVNYTRCVRKIADFYTAPEMTASWTIMDQRYGPLMRRLID